MTISVEFTDEEMLALKNEDSRVYRMIQEKLSKQTGQEWVEKPPYDNYLSKRIGYGFKFKPEFIEQMRVKHSKLFDAIRAKGDLLVYVTPEESSWIQQIAYTLGAIWPEHDPHNDPITELNGAKHTRQPVLCFETWKGVYYITYRDSTELKDEYKSIKRYDLTKADFI